MNFFKFTTGLNPDPLTQVRKQCAEWHGKLSEASCVEPLRRITLVGALYTVDATIQHTDIYYLRCAVAQCHAHGIPISPDFVASPINISINEEHDFLNTKLDLPSDLVLTCFLFKSPRYDSSSPMLGVNFLHDQNYYMESPHSHKEGAWHDAAQRLGAKVVMPIGGSTEITTTDFLPKAGNPSHFVLRPILPMRFSLSNIGILLSKPFAAQLRKANRCVLG